MRLLHSMFLLFVTLLHNFLLIADRSHLAISASLCYLGISFKTYFKSTLAASLKLSPSLIRFLRDALRRTATRFYWKELLIYDDICLGVQEDM